MKRSRAMVLVAVLAGSLFLAGPLWSATAPLWTTPFNFQAQGSKYNTINVYAVAASTNSLIVCGTAFDLFAWDSGQLGFIKAFDLATGQLKWEDTLTAGASQNNFSSLSIAGNTVLVDGYSCSYTYNPSTGLDTYTLNKSFLRAYNADAYHLLWEVAQDAATLNSGPNNIITANNKVFVVRNEKGFYDSSGSTGNCIVQAYQMGTVNVPVITLLLD